MKTSVFATALGQNQPDRSYFNSLYKFDPKKELAVYSLPFYDYATGKAIPNAPKGPSGILSASKLQGQGKEEVKNIQQDVEEEQPEEFERDNEEEEEVQNSFNIFIRSKKWNKLMKQRMKDN